MIRSYDIVAIREYFPGIENPSPSTWVYNQVKDIQLYGIRPLVVSPTPEIPRILLQLMKRKHTWKIKSSSKIESYLGVDVIRPSYLKLPAISFLNQNIRNVSLCIDNALKSIDFSLIHAHFGHAGISAIPLKLKRNVPLITSFYGFDLGSDRDRLRQHYKRLAVNGDLFLALSEDMANDLHDLNFPVNRIVVHHLGVDIEKFNTNKTTNNDSFVFTAVATFEERKGLQFVIEAFKEFIKGKDKDKFQLRLVGDGPYFYELNKLVQGYKNIVFVNNFISENPRGTVIAEMQLADVFLLTSITMPNGDKEGTPVVLMEAQACGKPCISTKHAGIPELVIDGVTGILTEERNVQEIVNAMELLFQDKKLREQMGIAARNNVERNFNGRIQIGLLHKIYRELIE